MQEDKIIREKLARLQDPPQDLRGDTAQVWELLEERLQNRGKRKPLLWQRAAAVLLLACIGVYFALPKEKKVVAAGKTKAVSPVTEYKEIVALPVKESSRLSEQAAKKQAVTAKEEISDNFTDTPTAPTQVNMIVQRPDTGSITPANIIAVTTTAPVAAPRKLRVVHMNELGELKKEARENVGSITAPVDEPAPSPAKIFPYLWTRKGKPTITLLTDN